MVLKDQDTIAAKTAHLRTLFDRAYANRHQPADMGLWVEYEHGGTVTYYLSPVSVTSEPGLVHHLNVVRSGPPKSTARLIAGNKVKSKITDNALLASADSQVRDSPGSIRLRPSRITSRKI